MSYVRSSPEKVVGVLLAAGAGSRFAGPNQKLNALVKGRSVIDWSLSAVLEAGFGATYLVVGDKDLSEPVDRARAEGSTVTVVHNDNWHEGMATSIRAGITQAANSGCIAVVVGLADQPFVPASAWRSVGAARGQIVVADFGGSKCPPVKLAQEVWNLLPATGDIGARQIIEERPDLVSEVPCLGNPIDIDTVEDLQRWS